MSVLSRCMHAGVSWKAPAPAFVLLRGGLYMLLKANFWFPESQRKGTLGIRPTGQALLKGPL